MSAAAEDWKSPWAYIAHKHGRWGGVIVAPVPKKDLNDFIAGFAIDGFSIMAVYSREEYLAELSKSKALRK